MKKIFITLAAIIGLSILTSTVEAAEVKVKQFNNSNNNDYYITLSGEIEEGDAEKLEAAYSDTRIKYNPVLFLHSPGGRNDVMRKIVKFLEGTNMRAVVKSKGSCYSACAVIWASSSTKFYQPGAEIGFHIGSLTGMKGAKSINSYIMAYGILGAQATIQESALDDILYLSTLNVKDPFALIKGVAEYGYDAWHFYMIDEAAATDIIGTKTATRKPKVVEPTPVTPEVTTGNFNILGAFHWIRELDQNYRIFVHIQGSVNTSYFCSFEDVTYTNPSYMFTFTITTDSNGEGVYETGFIFSKKPYKVLCNGVSKLFR